MFGNNDVCSEWHCCPLFAGGKDSKSTSRTSENAWDVSSPVAMPIKKRAFELLRLKYNESMADGIQILRYEHGQNYQVSNDVLLLV